MIKKKFAGLAILALLLFGCGEKKEIAVGDIVKKRVGGDKLKMVVLSVNEHDEKGSISHFKASDEDADFLPDEFKYYEWDYKSEYEDDSVLTESIALFNKYQIRRKYDEEGKIERVRLSDDNSPWWEDPIIDYYYSKTMKSEYYYNCTKRFYGYGDYLGSKNLPLGIDGKLNLNTLNWDYKNRDTKTLIEYYLREDGTVEKSIEYTGKEQFKHYASMEFRRRYGGFSSYDVPSLFPFYEYK